jgi:hypothetical protein
LNLYDLLKILKHRISKVRKVRLLGVHERRVKRGANQGTLIHPETGHEIRQSRSHYRITFKPTRDLRDKLRERLPTYRYEYHD